MLFADVLPGWEDAYQTWLTAVRALLQETRWTEAFARYPWVQPADIPFVPAGKPLNEMKLGVVSTAGFYLTGEQSPFTAEDIEGDPTFRELPTDVTPEALSIAHMHYRHDAALSDWNAVLPLDHLRNMVAAGELGSLGPIFSISGYCTDVARLLGELAEIIARRAREAGCDAMLLVPVWPVCHQSGGLIGRTLERAGIPTAAVGQSKVRMVTVKFPRGLVTRFERGQTMGPPQDSDTQMRVLRSALDPLRTAEPGEIRWLGGNSWLFSDGRQTEAAARGAACGLGDIAQMLARCRSPARCEAVRQRSWSWPDGSKVCVRPAPCGERAFFVLCAKRWVLN